MMNAEYYVTNPKSPDFGELRDDIWDIINLVTNKVGFDDYYTDHTNLWVQGEVFTWKLSDGFLEEVCKTTGHHGWFIREVMIDCYAKYKEKMQ